MKARPLRESRSVREVGREEVRKSWGNRINIQARLRILLWGPWLLLWVRQRVISGKYGGMRQLINWWWQRKLLQPFWYNLGFQTIICYFSFFIFLSEKFSPKAVRSQKARWHSWQQDRRREPWWPWVGIRAQERAPTKEACPTETKQSEKGIYLGCWPEWCLGPRVGLGGRTSVWPSLRTQSEGL